MPRTGGASIIISIVLWYQVDIMENEASKVVVVQRFFEPNIEELSSVERARIILKKELFEKVDEYLFKVI